MSSLGIVLITIMATIILLLVALFREQQMWRVYFDMIEYDYKLRKKLPDVVTMTISLNHWDKWTFNQWLLWCEEQRG